MKRSNSLFYIILFILTVGIAGQATAGRYYDPAYGRWTTFDPALNEKSPQELLELQNGKLFSHSPYSYAYDNPLKFIDPDGKTPIPWDYLDIGFAVWSVKDFLADPSWSNAGWAVYDVVAAAAPILPSSRYFRLGDKAADLLTKSERLNKARRLGKEGEKIVEGAFNLTKDQLQVRIPSITGSKNYRIADGLTDDFLIESKNVKGQSFTTQIKDLMKFADNEGLEFILVVNKDTKLSKPLQQLHERGKITIKHFEDLK